MIVNSDNFVMYAAKSYDMKIFTGVDDFERDLKRIVYVKSLIGKYVKNDDLRVRLILNHLIIIYNCFGSNATNMLFMKMPDYHSILRTFIEFLNFMPEIIYYENVVIYKDDIAIDVNVLKELESL